MVVCLLIDIEIEDWRWAGVAAHRESGKSDRVVRRVIVRESFLRSLRFRRQG